MLRGKLLEHDNIIRYAEKLKMEFLEAGSSSSVPQPHSSPSSSGQRKWTWNWSKILLFNFFGIVFIGLLL